MNQGEERHLCDPGSRRDGEKWGAYYWLPLPRSLTWTSSATAPLLKTKYPWRIRNLTGRDLSKVMYDTAIARSVFIIFELMGTIR